MWARMILLTEQWLFSHSGSSCTVCKFHALKHKAKPVSLLVRVTISKAIGMALKKHIHISTSMFMLYYVHVYANSHGFEFLSLNYRSHFLSWETLAPCWRYSFGIKGIRCWCVEKVKKELSTEDTIINCSSETVQTLLENIKDIRACMSYNSV